MTQTTSTAKRVYELRAFSPNTYGRRLFFQATYTDLKVAEKQRKEIIIKAYVQGRKVDTFIDTVEVSGHRFELTDRNIKSNY